jgi:membrane protein implicated in regulation of membrane protease activity
MTVAERLVLLLLALPFSTALAAAAYWALPLPAPYRVGTALLIFLFSEFVLHRLGAKIRSPVGPDALPGREAEVMAEFRPDRDGRYAGHVKLDGVRWSARLVASEEASPARGAKVWVLRVEGLTLWVTTARPRTGNERN